MSGIYTNYGRHARGTMLRKRDLWVALGRCDLSTGETHPWNDEANPPAEDPTNAALAGTFFPTSFLPDMSNNVGEMGPGLGGLIGIKLSNTTDFVWETSGSSGQIQFGGKEWSITSNKGTRHLYAKWIIEPGDFTVADDGVASITGYRRISILVDVNNSLSSATKGRYQDFFFSVTNNSAGTILFSSNEVLRVRDANEKHTIEIILPL